MILEKEIIKSLTVKNIVIGSSPLINFSQLLYLLKTIKKSWLIVLETRRDISIWSKWLSNMGSNDIVLKHYEELKDISTFSNDNKGIWLVSIPDDIDASFFIDLARLKNPLNPLLITNKTPLDVHEKQELTELLGPLEYREFNTSWLTKYENFPYYKMFFYNIEPSNKSKYLKRTFNNGGVFSKKNNLSKKNFLWKDVTNNELGSITIKESELEKYVFLSNKIKFLMNKLKLYRTSIIKDELETKLKDTIRERNIFTNLLKLNLVIVLAYLLKEAKKRTIILWNNKEDVDNTNYAVNYEEPFKDFKKEYIDGKIDVLAIGKEESVSSFYDADIIINTDVRSTALLESTDELLNYAPSALVIFTFLGETFDEEYLKDIYGTLKIEPSETAIVKNTLETLFLINEQH